MKNFHISVALPFLAAVISCSTPGEILRDKNPEVYREVIGTWYLLSKEEFGKVAHTLVFNDDGSFQTDMNTMGMGNFYWAESGHAFISGIDQKTPSSSSARHIFVKSREHKGSQVGITVTYGSKAFSKSDSMVASIYGDIHSRDKSIYKSFMPPLKELKIRISNGSSANDYFFTYTRNLSILPGLKKQHEASINNSDAAFASLNRKSLRDVHAFIKSCRDDDKNKRMAETVYNEILSTRTKPFIEKYISSRYPRYRSIMDHKIYDTFGNDHGYFYQLFRMPALAKKEVGITINLQETGYLGLQVTYEKTGQEVDLYLKKSGKHLIYHAIKGNDGLPRMILQYPQLQEVWFQMFSVFVLFPSFENLDQRVIDALSQ